VERLILDTGVLIAGARGRRDESAIAPDDDVALPAVVIAEFLAGVLLDENPARQAAQRQFLVEILAAMPVLDYNLNVAERHAELLAHTRRAGRPRGAHDLLIAATAAAAGRTILTTDAQADFDGLPGVSARLIIA
jgi:tRNA(fMet)-specific endonuclease VapC